MKTALFRFVCLTVFCLPSLALAQSDRSNFSQLRQWQSAVGSTATIQGGRVTFRDSSGRTIGSSDTNSNPSGGGNTVIRSQSGRTLGQAQEFRDGRIQFRDSSGRSVGSSQSSSGRTQFRDSSGRSNGSMSGLSNKGSTSKTPTSSKPKR